MHTTPLAPVCSPCGHVMQQVNQGAIRTLQEKAIGGQPLSYRDAVEYECVSCRTRVAISGPWAYVPDSCGYQATERMAENLAQVPAFYHVCAEHLPAEALIDSRDTGGPMPKSQRQQAARLVQDFFETDSEKRSAITVLLELADLLGVDVEAAMRVRARAIWSSLPSVDRLTLANEDTTTEVA